MSDLESRYFESGVAEWIYQGKGKILAVWQNRDIRDRVWMLPSFRQMLLLTVFVIKRGIIHFNVPFKFGISLDWLHMLSK